jgi:chorismate mutase
LNLELLRLLELRGRTVRQVMSVKQRLQIARYDGTREQQMMETLLGAATGVYTDAVLVEVFKAIFAACRELQPEDPPASPSRKAGRKRTRVSSGRGH